MIRHLLRQKQQKVTRKLTPKPRTLLHPRRPAPKRKRRNRLRLRLYLFHGAEEGTRTPTWEPTLDPESSASTNSATSAHSILDIKLPRNPPLVKQNSRCLRIYILEVILEMA